MNADPKTITIEQYKETTIKSKQKQQALPAIPVIRRPTRRGGQVQKLKREKAILMRQIYGKPPPSWEAASHLWKQVNDIEFQMEQRLERRASNAHSQGQ